MRRFSRLAQRPLIPVSDGSRATVRAVATTERRRNVKARRFLFTALVAALAAVVAAPGAYAETTKCTSSFNGAVKFDNIKVPKDATCTLTGTRVKGNIKVGRGATLIARDVKVGGNIQGKEFDRVVVNGTKSKVGGNIQLKEGDDTITLTKVKVKGDVQLFENFEVITLTDNKIGGTLQCKENWEEPIAGSGNKVKGNAEDQCDISSLATEI
jgi:hypothetical protein